MGKRAIKVYAGILVVLLYPLVLAGGERPAGNLNDDFRVDILDLQMLAGSWLEQMNCQDDCPDLNNDGRVDLEDFGIISHNWLVELPPLVISEFMAANDKVLWDEDGDSSDWIEILNTSGISVSLAGLYLTDDMTDMTKWQFPEGVTLEPGGRLVVFASGKNRSVAGSPLHTNFHLSKAGEYLGLIARDGRTAIYEFRPYYPEQLTDYSYGIMESTEEKVLVPESAAKWALVPTGSISDDWKSDLDFDVSGWKKGTGSPGGVGYERHSGYQNYITIDVGEEMYGINGTCYIRIPFELEDAESLSSLELEVRNDDAFVAYINGVEVARSDRVPSVLSWNSRAVTNRPSDSTELEEFDISSFIPVLQSGKNLLAIHGLNGHSTTSSDFLISARLSGSSTSQSFYDKLRYFRQPTPGYANKAGIAAFIKKPQFSRPGGLFSEPFELTLTTDEPGTVIRYTTNGTTPTEASVVYSGPISISSTTRVRARLYSSDNAPGPVVSQSYLALANDVKEFSSDIPLVIVDTNSQGLNASNYKRVDSVFIDIGNDGRARMLGPADYAGLGGIKKRGSSTAGSAKPSYAFETWDEDNEDKDVSIYGFPSDSDWVLYSPYYYDRALINNAFAYELSNQVGRYAVRTRFVEMFLNTGGGKLSYDDYVGLYIFMEKIKRGKDRVDVERLSTADNTEPQVSGGYMLKIDRLDPGDSGLRTNRGTRLGYVYPKEDLITAGQRSWIKNYLDQMESALYGANFRDPQQGYAKYIDVDSFIDHDLINMLMMNVDALRLSTYMFKKRGGKLEMGPIWDFDRAMESTDGRDNNPESWHGTGDGTDYFHWGWWDRFFQDKDFYLKFMDRWYELRQEQFSLENIYGIIDRMADELDEAHVRHFQRWTSTPPRFGGFAGEIANMKQWFQRRVNWIDNQFFRPPIIEPSGGVITAGTIITLQKAAGLKGAIYYTLDGSDPREPITGAVSSNARKYNQTPFAVDHTLQVRARILNGERWSAIAQAVFVVGDITDQLRVTEIMYHPADPPAGNPEAEFIELQNISEQTVNLNLVHFEKGIDFAFGDMELPPAGYVLVVGNRDAFAEQYPGFEGLVAGEYGGSLDNNGERIRLTDGLGRTILDFAYKDGWQDITDGEGFSLTIVDPANADPCSWNDKDSWRASTCKLGSPGKGDTMDARAVIINEILANSDGTGADVDWIELHNTTGQDINIGGWYLSDDGGSEKDLKKYRIADDTVVPAGGYIVFNETEHFGRKTGDPCSVPFALKETGETVYLTAADGGELLGYRQEGRFGASEEGVSFGPYIRQSGEVDYVPLQTPTPGEANADYRVGPIVISEIMYNPGSGEQREEYIELLNISGQPVTLYNEVTGLPWKFTDGIEFTFPVGEEAVTLGTGECIVLAKDKMFYIGRYGNLPSGTRLLGPYEGQLSNKGEKLTLSKPVGSTDNNNMLYVPEDYVRYDDEGLWPREADGPDGDGSSLTRVDVCRYGNDAANWMADRPSPGQYIPPQ